MIDIDQGQSGSSAAALVLLRQPEGLQVQFFGRGGDRPWPVTVALYGRVSVCWCGYAPDELANAMSRTGATCNMAAYFP